MVKHLLNMKEALGSNSSIVKLGVAASACNSNTQEVEAKDYKFRSFLVTQKSLRPDWAIQHPVIKTTKPKNILDLP